MSKFDLFIKRPRKNSKWQAAGWTLAGSKLEAIKDAADKYIGYRVRAAEAIFINI